MVSAYDLSGSILEGLKKMSGEDAKRKLFDMMKTDRQVGDLDHTVVSLEKLTGLVIDVAFDEEEYKQNQGAQMNSPSTFQKKQSAPRKKRNGPSAHREKEPTGLHPEAGLDNSQPGKMVLTEALMEHFLNLVMLYSVTYVSHFNEISPVFRSYQASELDSLLHRALCVTSIRFYSKIKGLQVFKLALYNRMFRDYYRQVPDRSKRVKEGQLVLRYEFDNK
jgi:hypothetical protein